MNAKKHLVRIVSAWIMLALISAQASAGPGSSAAVAREYRQAHEQQLVDEFAALLKLPNVATDGVAIRKNAEYIAELLRPKKFLVELLEAPGSPPAVFAERLTPGADKTLMIYVHYDGQPVNAADWASDPWTPVMRDGLVEYGGQEVPMKAPFDPEWRIFGRSAGDDKGPIIALIAGLEALDQAGIPLTVNLKVFFEGEEEQGSPHLEDMLNRHKEKLDADLWLFCDGPVHQSRQWQLVNGVRGSFGFGLTVYGPNRPLHSGHYGNWAPNPIMLLIDLIASMRAPDGTILIDGYLDRVVPPSLSEMEAIDAAPPVDSGLVRELGIGRPETHERLELAIMRPALNLRGIHSGDIGSQARNAIQPSATASIGLRLVPDLTPEFAREKVEQHIRQLGYHIMYQEPGPEDRAQHDRIARLDWGESGYPAYRSDFDLPMIRQIAGIMNELSDGSLVRMPSMGGSLPIYLIEKVTGTPVVILPIANHDNNQHGKDENLRLQNLWDAIEIYAAVLTNL
jgi:acetylornithine deacetylase/succinyl-diaminopimelate desuccinylase-like protein